MKVCAKDVMVRGGLVRIARLAAEGFEFWDNPEAALTYLRDNRCGIDLVTFMQKLPAAHPQYDYPMEWDNVAALPLSSFDHWWAKQIDGKTRNMVRRAEKKGLVVREVPFDDDLVKGIWDIYNECPVRQGRRFQHYGKNLEAVRRMSATFIDRSVFIGAFLAERLIGFAKLTTDDAQSQTALMHIIAMLSHRDKSPTNALVAQAVKSSCQRGIPYLVYSKYSYGKKSADSLTDFKASNGFQRIDIPRYYVPFTRVGRVALTLGLHHSPLDCLPEPMIMRLRQIRSNWYTHKSSKAFEAS